MNISLRRVYAIFQKDVKDMMKNLYVSTALLMPLLLAAFYGKVYEELPLEAHFLVINLTFVMIGAYVQSALIAEEKEKNTLRGLMLSPATIPEILGGKSLVTFIVTIITIVICSMLMRYEPTHLFSIAIAMIISVLFYIALGTLIGLLSKSAVEASVIMLPMFFLFGFGTFIEMIIEKYPTLAFAKYLPNIQLLEFAKNIQAGQSMNESWLPLVVIFAWAVGMSMLTVIVFRKKEMDD